MVGFTIAILLTLAAVSFAASETRLMGISRERLDLEQSSRAAIDLIAEDLKQAGSGIGYRADGTFAGLLLDRFEVNGVTFNPDGGDPTEFNPGEGVGPGARAEIELPLYMEREVLGDTYDSVTTDIGILTANGAYATIQAFNFGGSGVFCRSAETFFRENEIVVLRSQSSLDGFTARIELRGNDPCDTTNGHDCVNGCTTFDYVANPIFVSDPTADQRSYLGGEIAGGVKTIVWFIVADGGGTTLRRAIFDDRFNCDGRNALCGNVVVNNIESMVAQAWTFSRENGVWTNAGQVPIATNDRIRVDVEMVIRGRKAGTRMRMPVALNLLPNGINCIPNNGNCNEPADFGQRTVIRTSVEIKNSGEMSLE